MNIHQFFSLIGRKRQTIVSIFVTFLAIAIIFSAAVPFKYDSNLKLLTIISFKDNIDPYTASRSNEYLSSLLANIVSSGSFFEKVKEAGFKIDKNYFSGTEKQQLKKWNKTVKAKSIADTGMISVDVYHPNQAQAEEIARAVAYTLQTTNSQYHGFGNGVEIKIINQPTTSNYPVLPNVPLNFGLAVAFAGIFSLCFVYLFPEERYDLRLWPKKKESVFTEIEFNNQSEAEFTPAVEPVFVEAAEGEVMEEAESIEEKIEEYQEQKENILNNYQEYSEEKIQNNGSMENIFKR
jgi:capsular polysaccharide biosynthesis protein